MPAITGKIADNIQRHPVLYSIGVFLLTAIGVFLLFGLTIGDRQYLPGLKIDNSFEVWFRTDDPGKVTYDQLKEYFGGDEFVVVAFQVDDVFVPTVLEKIKKLTNRFSALPDVSEVTSLTNIDDFRSENDTLIIEELFKDIPATQQEMEVKKRRILANPLFTGNIISEDGRTTALIIEASTEPEEENYQRKLSDRIYRICEEEREDGRYDFKVAGSTILVGEEDKASTDDTVVEYSLCFGFVIILLYLSFRRIIFVVAPLGIIVIANIWTHAMLPVFGASYNMVLSIIATLVLVIGIADAIHLVSEYVYQAGQGKNARNAARNAFIIVAVPCFFTSLTTAAGFMSMMVSQLIPVKDFGFFSGIAMLATLVANMVVMMLVLTFIRTKSPAQRVSGLPDKPHPSGIMQKVMDRVARINRRYVTVNIVLAFLVILVSLTGIYRIKVNTNEIEYFPEDHRLPSSIRFIDDHLTGTMSLEVILTGEPDIFLEPEQLRRIDRLQKAIDEYPEVVKTFSVNDYLKEIYKVMYDNDKAYYRIPETVPMVAQFALISDDSLNDYLYITTYEAARIHGRFLNLDSTRMTEISKDIQKKIDTIFKGDEVRAELTGTMKLYVNAVTYIIQSQIRGFSLALVVIFVLMSLLVRSVKLGLIAMIPNIIPIFLTFGIMGWAGINLDFGTVIVASVAIGLAVDDTIHFISRFKSFYRKVGKYDDAIDLTIRHVGPPIAITSIVLFFGFIVLIVSTFKPIVFFGILAAITMVSAMVADLFVLPALIKVFKPFGKEKILNDNLG